MLYLACNLAQEAGLETVLSAAFSLKHAADMKKSHSNWKKALDRAVQLVPKVGVQADCNGVAGQGIARLGFSMGP